MLLTKQESMTFTKQESMTFTETDDYLLDCILDVYPLEYDIKRDVFTTTSPDVYMDIFEENDHLKIITTKDVDKGRNETITLLIHKDHRIPYHIQIWLNTVMRYVTKRSHHVYQYDWVKDILPKNGTRILEYIKESNHNTLKYINCELCYINWEYRYTDSVRFYPQSTSFEIGISTSDISRRNKIHDVKVTLSEMYLIEKQFHIEMREWVEKMYDITTSVKCNDQIERLQTFWKNYKKITKLYM